MEGNLHGVMIKVLDCGLEISEFKLQSYCYFTHITSGKAMNPFMPPAMS